MPNAYRIAVTLLIVVLICPVVSEARRKASAPLKSQEMFYRGDELIDTTRFKTIADRALSRSEMQGTLAGFKVVDMRTGTTVYDLNGDSLFNPASNMKIVTTAAALVSLGPDYRYTTLFSASEPLDGEGRLRGNLYIIGQGDPWLVEEHLTRMAEDLYKAGLRKVEGHIVVDDTYFDSVRDITGWENKSVGHCYAASIGALSVNFNSLTVFVYPAETAGRKARIEVMPRADFLAIRNLVKTTKKGRSSLRVKVAPEQGKYRINVEGRINVRDTTGFAVCRKIDNPPLYAGRVIADYLKRQGIALQGTVKVQKTPDNVRYVLWSHRSPDLTELVMHLNKESNNFMAEQTFITVGAEMKGRPGTWEKGARFTDEFLFKVIGAKNGSYQIQNGSGLGLENRLSPDLLVRVLQYMSANPNVSSAFISSLPVMGLDGTLRNRHKNSEASSRIRAKTGLLNNVMTLSGYVDTRGCDRLVFSLLLNRYDQKRRVNLRKIQDELILAMSNLVLHPGTQSCLSTPAPQ